MKMNKHIVTITIWFVCVSVLTMSGQTESSVKSLMQKQFSPGIIVSISDTIGCYRLKGNNTGEMYGYCKLDKSYSPLFASEGGRWSFDGKEENYFVNSNCYTIIAPAFDYALPFSDGWAAVSQNKKWTYVSVNGDFMCDYVLDAAYPFKNGKAKIRYFGIEYEIDTLGHGLPPELLAFPREKKSDIVSLTVNQLVAEGQYEKAIELGNFYLSNLMPSGFVYDLPPQDILPVIRLIFATNGAKNKLMALLMHDMDLFSIYKSIETIRGFSYLTDSPSLLYYDFLNYYDYVKDEINDNTLKRQIERIDYKYAVAKFEKEYLNDSTKIISSNLRYLYYFLLALSGDFEHVNMNTIKLAENIKDMQFQNEYDYAIFLSELKQYNTALQLFDKISKFHKQSILTGKCYHHIALIYYDLGMEKEAVDYFQKSIALYKEIKAPSELILDAMTGLLSCTSSFSIDQYSRMFREFKNEEILFDISLFSNMDSYTLNKQWGLSVFRINKVLSTILTHEKYSKCDLDAYELTVFRKSILQDAQSRWQQDALASQEESLLSLYKRYAELRKDYIGVDIFDLDNDSVYTTIEPIFELERRIKRMLYNTSSIVSPSNYNCFNSIKKVLQEDEVAIEFFSYSDNRTERYGAWVVTSDKDYPKFIDIMDEDICASYTADFRYDKKQETINDLFSSDFGTIIWGEFDGIAKYNTVYFSPSDVLGEIGIENLPYGQDALSFMCNTHRVTSTLIIPSLKNTKSDVIESATLFGGLDYGKSLMSSDRGVSHSGFLKYSRKEVDDIEQILINSCKINKYVEKEGIKNILLSYQGQSPSIIHIATHGWQKGKPFSMSSFTYRDRFDYYKQNKDLENEDWLLYTTGLSMSKQDNMTDSLGNILFSSEIANTTLQNTSLVVLSACNTIAGDLASGYSCTLGLNYALERAKVKNIISSLWSINDKKTYEFMILFYTKLVSFNDIYKAFHQTVSTMRERYPNNPEIWSSFILVENPLLSH